MNFEQHQQSKVTQQIIEKTRVFGASLAGLAAINSLRENPTHKTYPDLFIPPDVKAVLVFALVHQESAPVLDWWDGSGGTPGNRKLIRIARKLNRWLTQDLQARVYLLPYQVEKGGIFLKDAAVLAGLGVLGSNNLLITPQFGPRVRLRALFLDLEPAAAVEPDFFPCDGCAKPCFQACPQGAFDTGSYNKSACQKQMSQDEAQAARDQGKTSDSSSGICIKYCRACELSCPQGSSCIL
ncbi:hypothetical protein ACFL27_14070 [candidate division CSSED10-310 bacterium]|uniref:4Fe-4S ferredoxin-type domain-containing protein n=1 Tax=candidate division CSSED10-310 bacterium TaxID=2855610 RepID=A0ABV6YYP6_UNCC1